MTHAARIHKPLRPHPLALAVSRAFTASAMLAAMPLALAAPQGGTVTAGQAAIQHNGSLTTITQGSQRAAIDWRSFNVGAAETVNFVQPNASSAILNRVVGNDPSAIFGRITANGQVMLINPNGILFGRTAQVDVGALTATTSNLSNADFMAGRLQFTEPGRPGATVENQGRITVAEGGFAALVGRQVANSGVITARLGKVALAGGDAFVLDLYGDKLVNLVVDPAALGTLTDAQGQPLAARVDHSGQIVADGGRVQLSVATVRQLVDNLINLSGVVRASSFTQAPGVISLQGDAATRVNVSGTLDTSGESRGGRVEVTGREVNLQPGALLAATGGQGSIAVGGDWQGRGPLAHAEQVNVAEGALLDAGGGTQGQGGTVVLWSGQRTQFAGRIAAGGGSVSGDGGQVEVSSKGTLGFQGEVDVFAVNGRQGALLLDPLNLTIAATGSGDSQIAADQLRYFLTRGASVTLSADNNVTVDAEVNGLVSSGGGVAGGGLTLTAGNNLSVNQNIVLNNGALNLTATNGTLTQADGAVLYTGNGAATLRGGAGVDLGQVLSGGAVDIRSGNGAVNVRNALVAATANGTAAPLASLVVSGSGSVSLNGALVQGTAQILSTNGAVHLAGAVVQSNAGNVLVSAGTTVTSSANNIGLVSQGATTVIAGGAIDLGVLSSTGETSLSSTNGGVTVRQAVTGASGTTHGLTIQAAGPVALAGANAGAGGISVVTAGDITSQGAGSTEGALVSTGDVFLTSTTGHAGTTAAPLRVRAEGDLSIEGSAGVAATTVLGRGDVNVSSGAGSVVIEEAIAAVPGDVTPDTAPRPDSVNVSGHLGVDMAGATAGAGGVTLRSSDGGVAVRNSIFSEGAVSVTAQGAVSVLDGAGIVATRPEGDGSVSLLSHGGTVTLGNGGIRVEGTGAGVSLTGAAGVIVDGDVQAQSGQISLSSGNGAVRVLASASDDTAANATLHAGQDPLRSIIDIQAQGNVEVGEMVAYNRVQIHTNTGNVTLRRGLGGNTMGTFNGSPALLNTGYVDHARGYLSQYRPNVGRLVITAANGSVELNGLNLDGNAGAADNTPGLYVLAGRRIVSNNEIAVNKGDIVLAGGTTQATDGVYLGSSVYSRGHDVVNNGVRSKTGYGIRITGRVLGMFDNTNEMAQLPVNTFETSWYTLDADNNPVPHLVRTDAGGFLVDAAGMRVINPDGSFQMLGLLTGSSVGDLAVYNVNASGTIVSGPDAGSTIGSVRGVGSVIVNGVTRVVQQQIAKIEIANNVANYQDTGNQRTLVEANTGSAAGRVIELGTTTAPITIAGVANHTPGTAMRITGPTPVLTAPSQVPIISAPAQDGAVAATHGIGLKLLSFREAGDTGSQVWGGFVRMINSGDSNNFFFRLTGTGGALSIMDVQSTPPVEGVFTVTAPVLAQRTFTLDGETVTQVAQVPTGTTTYTFQIEDGPNGGEVARLVSIGAPVNANLASLVTPPPSGATDVSAWSFTTWRDEQATARVRLEPPQLAVAGVASGVRINGGLYGRDGATGPALQSGSTVAPNYSLMRTDLLQQTPFGALQGFNQFSDPRTFQIDRILVDSVSGARAGTGGMIGTRVFAYDGAIETSNGSRTFDGNTGVLIPGLNGISGFNNSTVGFAGVGVGFASTANGSAGGTGVGSTSGQGVGGAFIPGGQSGAGSVPAVDDRSSQDTHASTLPASGGAGQPGTSDLAFSVRMAAEADLGRGGAVPGSAVNVFKKRYRLATSSNANVCAPGVVQSTPAEGGAARDCAGP